MKSSLDSRMIDVPHCRGRNLPIRYITSLHAESIVAILKMKCKYSLIIWASEMIVIWEQTVSRHAVLSPKEGEWRADATYKKRHWKGREHKWQRSLRNNERYFWQKQMMRKRYQASVFNNHKAKDLGGNEKIFYRNCSSHLITHISCFIKLKQTIESCFFSILCKVLMTSSFYVTLPRQNPFLKLVKWAKSCHAISNYENIKN